MLPESGDAGVDETGGWMPETDGRATAMDRNQQKGLFGEELVDVLAVAAGLTTAKENLDIRGVDRTINLPGERGHDRPALVEVQVKAWTPHGKPDDFWHFRMSVKHYNMLVGKFGIPRYLFLVVLPADPADWIESTPDGIRIKQGVYWANLMGRPLSTAPGESKLTVKVPRENLLTVDGLVRLFDYSACSGVVTP